MILVDTGLDEFKICLINGSTSDSEAPPGPKG